LTIGGVRGSFLLEDDFVVELVNELNLLPGPLIHGEDSGAAAALAEHVGLCAGLTVKEGGCGYVLQILLELITAGSA
jgi:hypothetical protein